VTGCAMHDVTMSFLGAIRGAGLHTPETIIPDGVLHRFSSTGKRGDDSGWYVFHADGIPAGCFGDWRTGLTQSWRADIGRTLTADEESAHRAKIEAMRKTRKADEIRRHAAAAKQSEEIWQSAEPATDDYPYLTNKGIKAHGARMHDGRLVIPMREGGKIHSLQYIDKAGDKRFLTGGRVTGCYFSIGNVKEASALCITEGFATGATIHEATGYPVAVAFNTVNLEPVAKTMRERFPDLPLILCADDDFRTKDNPGITKASEGAQSVGGIVVMPEFSNNRPEKATDFNDMAALSGLEAVATIIKAALSPAQVDNPAPVESNKSINTIDTINTFNALGADVSTLPSTLDPKSDDPGKLKDSLLSEAIADDLADTLVFDEVSLDWFQCKKGIWQPVSKTRSLKLINRKLHQVLPNGFSLSKLSSIEAFLRIYLSLDKWETCWNLLPMKNGVLDTQTLELIDYSPQHRFRWQLPYEYDPDAKIDIIRQWLWEVTGQDIETVNTLRAFMKLAVCGGDIQKFLEVIGPGGTGKSTLIRLMIMLLGEPNHAATDLKNLEGNRFEAATLYGKRLAVISDSSRYGGEVSVLKAITGGDPVRHERKNQQQSGSFVFDGVVVIASNEAIQSTDYSSGLARRRLPVMFNRKVTDEDKAKWRKLGGIEKAMKAELPGLLNWVLAMTNEELNATIGGINGNLTNAQREHFCETNKIAAWLNDNLVLDEQNLIYMGGSTGKLKDSFDIEQECKTKLYPNYEWWCSENGVNPIAVQRFSTNIVDVCEHVKINIEKLKRNNVGVRIRGLAIRTLSDAHLKKPTPITKIFLNSDDGCRSRDEGNTPASRESVNGVDGVDENSLSDAEVF